MLVLQKKSDIDISDSKMSFPYLESGSVYARFNSCGKDVGTIDLFGEANMEYIDQIMLE